MEILLVLAVAYMAARAFEDGWSAVHGTVPGRYQAAIAKANARTARSTARTARRGASSRRPSTKRAKPARPRRRHTARAYFGDLWHDSWADARTHRQAKRATRATATAKRPNPRPADLRPEARPHRPVGHPFPQPTRVTAAQLATEPSPREVEEAADAKTQTSTGPAGDGATGQPETPAADTERKTPMSTPTLAAGEATTLAQALAWCDQMSAACTEGVTACETTQANLAAAEVTDAADDLATAQEQLSAAASAFDAAKDQLENLIGVKDAYAAANNQGTKEFVINE